MCSRASRRSTSWRPPRRWTRSSSASATGRIRACAACSRLPPTPSGWKRFAALPIIETILVKNDELSPQGGGEPAIPPMGAVVANAVFDATGVLLYRLPMTPERVLAALKGA